MRTLSQACARYNCTRTRVGYGMRDGEQFHSRCIRIPSVAGCLCAVEGDAGARGQGRRRRPMVRDAGSQGLMAPRTRCSLSRMRHAVKEDAKDERR
jgi:hypothetical protein